MTRHLADVRGARCGAQRTRRERPPRRVRSGFSIIELLVAVAVGLVLTLAVTFVLLRNERFGRGTLAVNDINQTGAYAAYLLDEAVRSGGSGFSNRWTETYGCRINATRNAVAMLPRTAAWPAPFAGFTQSPRVAPVIVGKGQSAGGSDVIAVMRGSAGLGETPMEVLALGPPLGLRNTIGLAANNLLLLADGAPDCLLLQSGVPAGDTVPLDGAGSFHTTLGTNRSLVDFGTPTPATVAVNLGNVGAAGAEAPNPPRFTLFGVGDNRTLFTLDMLGLDGGTPQPMAEGVVELRALYGVDSNGDGVLDSWADPGTAPWDTATLLTGSPVAQQAIGQIIALRIGLVLRTSRAERETVAPATLVLFGDLGVALQQTRNLSADERLFRHRTIEQTVPLRNVLLSRTP